MIKDMDDKLGNCYNCEKGLNFKKLTGILKGKNGDKVYICKDCKMEKFQKYKKLIKRKII